MELRLVYRGKVRDVYEVDTQTMLFVATDRISAFDVIMKNCITNKGKILNQISKFWFEKLQGIGLNHMITTDLEKMPEWVREQVVKNGFEGRCMLVKKLKMIPIEAIVRGYIVGSAWKEYQSTGKVCGIELVKGLAQYEKLPEVIFTPSTKVESGHDENITFEQAEAIIGSDLAKALRAKAIEYYLAAESWARSRGIIIADTKMEFGLDENGKLVVADELFTPDCSRFWGENQSRELSYDKQLVRNYLESINFDKKTPVVLPDSVVEGTLAKYVEIYRLLTDSEPQL